MKECLFTTPDFTEARYCELLDAVGKRYKFVSLHDRSGEGDLAIWRHDVDMSLHRARALADIEAQRGIAAHYFIHLGSAFYSPFEPRNRKIIREIAGLGHEIGLHFDASVLSVETSGAVEAVLREEADSLSDLLGQDIACFSIHNPTVNPHLNLESETHAGLVNASAPSLYEEYTYCSDSNGVWRFRPVYEVMADPEVTKLYLLTHPVWWTLEPMAPRQRVQRAIDGRAAATLDGHDAFLARHGRPNDRD